MFMHKDKGLSRIMRDYTSLILTDKTGKYRNITIQFNQNDLA